jgi:hypothetical protein
VFPQVAGLHWASPSATLDKSFSFFVAVKLYHIPLVPGYLSSVDANYFLLMNFEVFLLDAFPGQDIGVAPFFPMIPCFLLGFFQRSAFYGLPETFFSNLYKV